MTGRTGMIATVVLGTIAALLVTIAGASAAGAAEPTARAKQVALGATHVCATTTGGAARCWGSNVSGALGTGDTVSSGVPRAVVGLGSGVTDITAGFNFSCAVIGGRVRCWGSNDSGQLGNGTRATVTAPVVVAGLTNVVQVSAGDLHTCARTATGSVWCWGSNGFGALGIGTTADSLVPQQVSGLTSGVVSISTGSYHTCALLSSGTVRCWGLNDKGQLGTGAAGTNATVPVTVAGLSARSVSAGGSSTCALTTDFGPRCWGANQYGQLGDGTTTDRSAPTAVSGLGAASSLDVGAYHACAVVGGGATCWGYNAYGGLGNGSNANSSFPVSVFSLGTGVWAVAAGDKTSCAVMTNGYLRCWGLGNLGQLGTGGAVTSAVPLTVATFGDCRLLAVDDTYRTPQDVELSVNAPGVLGNDQRCGSDRVAATTAPAHGRVVVSPTGALSYRPDRGFVGTDSFRYTVTAGSASSTATVRITVTSTAPSELSRNRSYVRALYTDFLDREPSASELASRAQALTDGSLSRRSLVEGLATSPEWVSHVVDGLYQDTLGRAGDARGTAYWTNRIRRGDRTVAQVAAAFYASDEYFRGIGGGTNATWITDLYTKLLDRPVDRGGLAYWQGVVARDGRSAVAGRLYQSAESRRQRVEELYLQLLGRRPDAAGSAHWARRILTDGDLALAAQLAVSDEYANRAVRRFP